MLAHAPVEATPAKSRPAPPSTSRPRPPIPALSDGVVLQRKSACACGGGCPGCQSATSNLTIGEPDDAYELEADHVADQVMRMPDASSAVPIRRFTAGATLRRHAGSHAVADVAAADLSSTVARGTSGGGHTLDMGTRTFMESRFGHDFGDVRIHTGVAAAESARSIGAIAYTVGSDIVFGAGRYAPDTSEGRWLLSHELTHTIQQGREAHGVVQMVGECDGKSKGNCSGSCVHANGNPGTCRWSGTIKNGCVCYENPKLSPAQQVLYELIMAALIAAGIVITLVLIAAVVACLMGPCEAAALIAAVGFAAAMIILAIVKSGGGGASAEPLTAAAEGGAPSDEAMA